MDQTPRDVIDTPAGDFLILSRLEAGQRTLTVPYVMVSITAPGSPDAVLAESPFRLAVLRLQFRDAETQHGMAEAQADEVARFILAHRDQAGAVIVHCELGISRSAGVAAGLAEAMNGSLDPRFAEMYDPNRRARRLVVEAAERCGLADPMAMRRAQGLWA
jgi:predicted protein tyrosine phosphatase